MLTEAEIKRLIEDDAVSDRKRQAAVGQRYYEAEHDILNYRMFYYNADGVLVEDKARSNSRICHPFFTEHVDQLVAFILSFEENPIQAKPAAEGLQDHLDTYFDDEFWAEMSEVIGGATSKGFDYIYGFKNADDRLAFQHADSLGVVEVRANETDDGCEYIIYWYVERIGKDKKLIKRIQVHDKDQIWFFTQVDDGKLVPDENQVINPRPNIMWQDPKTGIMYGDHLGFIPFWRLDYNRKQQSALKPIKGLIDDYDLMECGLSNNVQDFDTPIHLVKGFDGDNLTELQQNIKTKKIMGVPGDGGLDILTVDIPVEARKTKADEDEKNIYRFGMAFNSSQAGDGNITNVVIRSRYTLLELKADKLEKRLKRFLKGIIMVVLDEINAKNGTDYQYTDVEVHFEHIVPTNEQENVQNAKTEAETEQIRLNSILNVATVIGDEETLKAVCDILDLEFDELKDQLEKLNEPQNTMDAMATLEGVVTDEQAAETGSEAIPE
jgi:SPP1 family phage portal protein